MKKFFAIGLCILMVIALVACAPKDTNFFPAEPEVEYTEGVIEDLAADAYKVLDDIYINHNVCAEFTDVLFNVIPDMFMLIDYHFEDSVCFLEMSDGIEYAVIVDDSGHVTSVFVWDTTSNTPGSIIYPPVEE